MRRAFRLRLRIVSLGVIVIALLLASRLYFVQVVQGEEFALRAERQYVSSSQELFDRGAIYFTRKDGTLISAATLTNGFLLAIDPGALKTKASGDGVVVVVGDDADGLRGMRAGRIAAPPLAFDDHALQVERIDCSSLIFR